MKGLVHKSTAMVTSRRHIQICHVTSLCTLYRKIPVNAMQFDVTLRTRDPVGRRNICRIALSENTVFFRLQIVCLRRFFCRMCCRVSVVQLQRFISATYCGTFSFPSTCVKELTKLLTKTGDSAVDSIRWFFLSGVYARGSKRSHTGG